MLPRIPPHARTATKRIVIYAGCMSSVLVAAFLFCVHGRLQASKSSPLVRGNPVNVQARPRLIASYGKLPLSFEANQGQAGAGVKFLSRGRGYGVFLTSSEAVLEVQESGVRIQDSGFRNQSSIQNPIPKMQNQVVRLRLVGVKPDGEVTGREELPGKVNYFIGNDPKKWRTNVPTYAKVRYHDVYPGVDLEYYGNQGGQLEYDFIVAPGADPSAITLQVGAVREPPLRIDADGDLVIAAKGGEIRFHKPQVYQEQSTIDSPQLKAETRQPKIVNRQSTIVHRQFREGGFRLDAQNRICFAVGSYDHSKPLVIDPSLVYSTYLGGNPVNGYYDTAKGIAVDSSGNAYLTGTAYSNNFPTSDPIQATNKAANGTVFVSKINASGSALIYSTYLGGSVREQGNAIAIDSSGDAYPGAQRLNQPLNHAPPPATDRFDLFRRFSHRFSAASDP